MFLHHETHNRAEAAEVHTDRALQNHQPIHHPNQQANQVQEAATHHQALRGVQEATHQVLHHARQEVAVAAREEAADQQEDQGSC